MIRPEARHRWFQDWKAVPDEEKEKEKAAAEVAAKGKVEAKVAKKAEAKEKTGDEAKDNTEEAKTAETATNTAATATGGDLPPPPTATCVVATNFEIGQRVSVPARKGPKQTGVVSGNHLIHKVG